MSTVFFTPYTNDDVFLPPFWRHNRRSYGGRHFRHGPCGPTKRTILSDTDKEVQLVLDVPGVKPTDLTVTIDNETLKIHGTRKIPGQQDRSFEKEYSIDEELVDTTNVQANLSDGVLVLTLAKTTKSEKGPETRTIEVIREEPSDDEDDKALKMPIDVPGIKLEDLKVEFDSNVLQIIGKRRVGRNETTMVRQYATDRKEFDTDQMTATLSEGVLFVTVPRRERQAPRSVLVTTEPYSEEEEEEKTTTEAVEAPTEATEPDSELEIASTDAVVETVQEDDEEEEEDSTKKATDDWEKVA